MSHIHRTNRRMSKYLIGFILLFSASCASEEAGSGNDKSVGTPASPAATVQEATDDQLEAVDGDADNASAGNPQGFKTLFDLLVAEQEYVATCMAGEGFEYVPKEIDPSLAGDSLIASENEFQRVDIEFAIEQAEQFGYGGLFDLLDRTAQDAVVIENSNPNDAIRDSLEPEEKQQWANALFGTDEGGGCINESLEFSRGQELASPEEAKALAELEFKVFEAVASDSRMVEAIAGWRECMTAEGYDFRDSSSGGDYISQQTAQILGTSLDSETDESSLQDLLSDPDIREALLTLLEEDRKVATLDVQCSSEIIRLENSLFDHYYLTFTE